MTIFQSIRMAFSAVASNKLRSFLTMLGIMIGVVALVVLVSIADSATDSVNESISGMGASYLTVRISDDKNQPLRYDDMALFMENEEIEAAAPYASYSVTAKCGYTSAQMQVIGTSGSFLTVMQYELMSGRNLMNADLENISSVIILTYETANELLGRADAVGESISLNGRSFEVIGVTSYESTKNLESSSNSFSLLTGSGEEEEEEETITLTGFIPYSSLTRLSAKSRDVTRFYVRASRSDSLSQAQEALTEILMERFSNDEEAFTISNNSQVMDTMESVNSTLSMMLGGIAAISLIVGGIGIMNISMVSVTERTREIGIRKAIGASQGVILMQFLFEAFILSMMGCLLGIAVSALILRIMGPISGGMTFSMNRKVAGLSIAFSGLIGIVFGLYPAAVAANKKPIDALHYGG